MASNRLASSSGIHPEDDGSPSDILNLQFWRRDHAASPASSSSYIRDWSTRPRADAAPPARSSAILDLSSWSRSDASPANGPLADSSRQHVATNRLQWSGRPRRDMLRHSPARPGYSEMQSRLFQEPPGFSLTPRNSGIRSTLEDPLPEASSMRKVDRDVPPLTPPPPGIQTTAYRGDGLPDPSLVPHTSGGWDSPTSPSLLRRRRLRGSPLKGASQNPVSGFPKENVECRAGPSRPTQTHDIPGPPAANTNSPECQTYARALRDNSPECHTHPTASRDGWHLDEHTYHRPREISLPLRLKARPMQKKLEATSEPQNRRQSVDPFSHGSHGCVSASNDASVVPQPSSQHEQQQQRSTRDRASLDPDNRPSTRSGRDSTPSPRATSSNGPEGLSPHVYLFRGDGAYRERMRQIIRKRCASYYDGDLVADGSGGEESACEHEHDGLVAR